MNNTKDAPRPFTLRLTPDERAQLEAEAGNQPLGTYMRRCLLEGREAPRKMRGQHVIKDRQALGQMLGLLGESELADSLRSLSRASEYGALPVNPETEKALQSACETVDAMGEALMNALGLRKSESARSLSDTFGDVH